MGGAGHWVRDARLKSDTSRADTTFPDSLPTRSEHTRRGSAPAAAEMAETSYCRLEGSDKKIKYVAVLTWHGVSAHRFDATLTDGVRCWSGKGADAQVRPWCVLQ